MSDKKFALVLHSHIPYVLAHGNWPHGMDWLYEAAAESYLPLLEVLQRLSNEGIPPKINIGFTPVLADQLKAPQFKTGFNQYLEMKIAVAVQDRKFFEKTGNRELLALTEFWERWYKKLRRAFRDTFREDIIDGFRALQDEEQIEILTSAATHAYFPLLARDESIRLQVTQGKLSYERYFGRKAKGFWIPECAYRPGYSWKSPLGQKESYDRRGVDEILGAEGIGYFFVDTHLLKGGKTKGVYLDRFPALKLLWEKSQDQYYPIDEKVYDPYSAYLAYPSQTPFFVRDDVSGVQVWSRSIGYPGDGSYLEFHKKHFPGGMRYWRITSGDADLGGKAPYEPEKARERLMDHAAHFVSVLENDLKQKKDGVVVAMYDSELLGHWWFEGPEWLYYVLKRLNQSSIKASTTSSILETLPPMNIISLPEGSWGQGGFHSVWLNEDTSWIWDKIYRIEDAASRIEARKGLNPRVWKQFLREKFLLESSDWPFLISTWTARDYAQNRAAEHFERARTIAEWLEAGRELSRGEEKLLETFEKEDHLFEELIAPDGQIIR